MEDELVEIHFSASSIEEARRVCRFLVQEKLVACGQIIPWMESVYLWNDTLDTSQESLVLLKTRRIHFETISKILKENSKYEVPEIIMVPILDAEPEYRDWLIKETAYLLSSKEK